MYCICAIGLQLLTGLHGQGTRDDGDAAEPEANEGVETAEAAAGEGGAHLQPHEGDHERRQVPWTRAEAHRPTLQRRRHGLRPLLRLPRRRTRAAAAELRILLPAARCFSEGRQLLLRRHRDGAAGAGPVCAGGTGSAGAGGSCRW